MLDDANQLLRSFPSYSIKASGLLELGTMAQKVDEKKLTEMGCYRKILGLAFLVTTYLGKPLRKGMAIANWACPNLTPEQKLCKISRMSKW
jgi:hypothetical protein